MAQTKFNLSHVNKIESLHGIMGKNLHPINSAPPNSKTEVILLYDVLLYVDKVYDCMCELREACVNQWTYVAFKNALCLLFIRYAFYS